MKQIKIMHLASGDLWAGAEVQLFTLVTNLNRRADTVIHVVLLNHGTLEQKLQQECIAVTVLDEAKLNGLRILLQLIRATAKIQPDIIHTHRIKENIFGSIAALLNRNIPSIRTAHGASEHRPSLFHVAKHAIFFLDWICARFLQKKTVAVSQDLADALLKSYPANKILVIENGIDIDKFTVPKREGPDHSTDNKPLTIAIAGRLTAVKRIDIFIETAQQLLQTHPELSFDFHIYGDGPLREELEQLSNKLQTKNMVHFKGHCSDMTSALKQLDILLLTSDHEGLPMILLEAMAARVQIITHAVGGIPRLLDDGKCGILIHENRPVLYAEAIVRATQQGQDKSKMLRLALDRLNKHYTAKINAKSYRKAYHSILK